VQRINRLSWLQRKIVPSSAPAQMLPSGVSANARMAGMKLLLLTFSTCRLLPTHHASPAFSPSHRRFWLSTKMDLMPWTSHDTRWMRPLSNW
jgi:hypothetical protein